MCPTQTTATELQLDSWQVQLLKKIRSRPKHIGLTPLQKHQTMGTSGYEYIAEMSQAVPGSSLTCSLLLIFIKFTGKAALATNIVHAKRQENSSQSCSSHSCLATSSHGLIALVLSTKPLSQVVLPALSISKEIQNTRISLSPHHRNYTEPLHATATFKLYGQSIVETRKMINDYCTTPVDRPQTNLQQWRGWILLLSLSSGIFMSPKCPWYSLRHLCDGKWEGRQRGGLGWGSRAQQSHQYSNTIPACSPTEIQLRTEKEGHLNQLTQHHPSQEHLLHTAPSWRFASLWNVLLPVESFHALVQPQRINTFSKMCHTSNINFLS